MALDKENAALGCENTFRGMGIKLGSSLFCNKEWQKRIMLVCLWEAAPEGRNASQYLSLEDKANTLCT